MSIVEELRGAPVLDGDVYCSPRCGFKCKKADYDAAVAAAHDLASQLGPHWTPSVWENCGWNWSVNCGSSSIMNSKRSGYGAWLNVPNAGCHSEAIQFIEYAETAEDALGFAVQKARGCIAQIQQQLDLVRGDRAIAAVESSPPVEGGQ